MKGIYNVGIATLRLTYWIASYVSPKAKIFKEGRLEQHEKLKSTFPLQSNTKLVWFHCASLGEFEQGRPVMEALKKWQPSIKILLTFFSPSGYEVRKNYSHADYIFYLPWDTAANAKWFADHVNPSLAIFVKYEFWYHYAMALQKRNKKLISISTILRPEQIFFRPYGGLFRTLLKCFDHFFVQNQSSLDLLKSIGIKEVTKAGDTRFDRVSQIINQTDKIALADDFKNGQKLMVIGSAWQEDMEVMIPFINEFKSSLKFIVAPHEINESFIREIENSIEGKTIRFSNASPRDSNLTNASVLIIDNIGMLSSLYRYGDFAFIGGAYRAGLHNILEAACFGVPVFFGDKAFQKYQEAVDLVFRGGAFEVSNFVELKAKYEMMVQQPLKYQLACDVTREYVKENLGATEKILSYCKKILA